MVDVRGDVLRPPHGTTPAAVKSNKNQKRGPFKSNENIHKKEGGSYYVVSANKASSVTGFTGYQPRPRSKAQNIQLFGPHEGFLTHQWVITTRRAIKEESKVINRDWVKH